MEPTEFIAECKALLTDILSNTTVVSHLAWEHSENPDTKRHSSAMQNAHSNTNHPCTS